MTEKKNPDYSASAVNLCNPADIGRKLMELQDTQAKARTLDATLQAMPEYQELKEQEKLAADIIAQVKGMVEVQGSYQDIESGFYAVKYQRISKSYLVEPFKVGFPKYATAVIEETVNAKALEGLVKGGLIPGDELKAKGVLVETPSYAFYIR